MFTLPRAPQGGFSQFASIPSRRIPFSSINFDYIPTTLESPRNLFVELSSPAPSDLLVGTPVRVHIEPGKYGSRFSKHLFHIDDVIGSRVVLVPYRPSSVPGTGAWMPTDHLSCGNPRLPPSDGGVQQRTWGYNLRTTRVSPSMHPSSQYGYGASIGELEYFPLEYNNRATQLQAVRMEEGWYGTSARPIVPGWKL